MDLDAIDGASVVQLGVCGNQVYMEHRVKCQGCGQKSHWKCPCGYFCCRAGASAKKVKTGEATCDAYFQHVVQSARSGGSGGA